jgi:hypothetical protein
MHYDLTQAADMKPKFIENTNKYNKGTEFLLWEIYWPTQTRGEKHTSYSAH